MPTIIDEINGAFGVYIKSCDRAELLSASNALAALLADERTAKIISDTNRENAQFLKIKIELKSYAVAYFCEGYENADFIALKAFAENAEAECVRLGFKKTGELCAFVLKCAETVNKITYDAVALKAKICDYEGRCVATDLDECTAVAAALSEKAQAVASSSLPKVLFTDGAYFPDIKTQLTADLNELCGVAENAAAEISKTQAEDVMRTGIEDVTEKLDKEGFTYFPQVDTERLARTITVCTPYAEEAEILAWSCAGGAKIFRVQALSFERLDIKSIDAAFAEIARQGADCVIYGLRHYRAKNKAHFLRAAIKYAKAGRRAYLVADDGTRALYEEALQACTDGLSALDVSFLYLSMPDFTQTVETMQSLGMISEDGADIDFVRKNLPFAGFAGLNEAVKAFGAGADWKKIVAERSQDNFAAAQKYMLKLPRQALFIDGGWGSYHEDIIVRKSKSFDYDDIKTVNPNNVKKIMEGNFSLFQKCGMISTYCMLCGSTAADWSGLPIEIKSERLTEATKLVMRALGVPIVPEVQVLDKLSVGGAGGLCCDGGKRILYKNSSVKDFDWTAKAVCHESFHAFQHYAINFGWQDWYETELHVTPGRIDMWGFNFSKYRSIDKDADGYMIQIVESDARAFESDCLGRNESEGQILNLIDLE